MAAVKKTKTTTEKTSVKKSTAVKTERKDRNKDNSNALVIVESPTKARTLSKYLKGLQTNAPDNGGKVSLDFRVIASGGHIIDLPKKKFGVDIEDNFRPDYELLPDKKSTAKTLKQEAGKAGSIYIATDPDREGEAIAWHISNLIKSRKKQDVWRVTFNEITKRAVQDAILSPGSIDINKVNAQQARRIMDRLVGYQVSPLLWKTITRGLSAGRVQSVALRLLCEREEDINAFIPEEYWTIDGEFKPDKIDSFTARFNKYKGKKVKIGNEDESNELLSVLKSAVYRITEISRSRKKRNPVPPYITSTMQQDAGRRLGMPVKRTMGIAQKLYEGIDFGAKGSIGLITYMRTDSTRIAEEANSNLRDWVASNYGADYLSDKTRRFKNKKGASQDAHEAIRPTDVTITPKDAKNYLTAQELKLYELIWKRFVATQMKPAEFDVTTVFIGDGKDIEFKATGQVLVFPGFLSVYEDFATTEKKKDDEVQSKLPKGLESGMPLDLLELFPKQHFTQPPPRFSEASLVKELDELGIGRPSTYASIISTLFDRKYAEKAEKALKPTELGFTVNRVLTDRFPAVFNIDFTAQMEDDLDRIETGAEWLSVVNNFYQPFSEALKTAEANYPQLKKDLVFQPVGKKCPECGEELIYRWSKNGRFISCSAFPKCKYAESLGDEKPVEVEQECPKCGAKMVVRSGRFGRFLGCSQYPKCKGILPLTTGHKCPVEGCSGEITEKKSKKGRPFYGCTKYPDCKFVSWDEPQNRKCPECKAPTVFIKRTKKNGETIYCSQCDWKETKSS